MATVWSYRVGSYSSSPDLLESSGWAHVINFNSLDNLISQLAGFENRVDRLAIVAHGDVPGDVFMNGTEHQQAEDFARLSPYVVLGGMLIFYSCIAGGEIP